MTPDPDHTKSKAKAGPRNSDTVQTIRGDRLGRPPLPRDQARSERVVSFVTPGELIALKKRADARNATLSSMVHHILSSALRKE